MYARNKFDVNEWGHLDDILLAHHDKDSLLMVCLHMQSLFKIIKWNLNFDKSCLIPTQKITFKEATWTPNKVIREK